MREKLNEKAGDIKTEPAVERAGFNVPLFFEENAQEFMQAHSLLSKDVQREILEAGIQAGQLCKNEVELNEYVRKYDGFQNLDEEKSFLAYDIAKDFMKQRDDFAVDLHKMLSERDTTSY